MRECYALAIKLLDQFEQASCGVPKRCKIGDLRAQMHIGAADGNRAHLRCPPVEIQSIRECDAELAFLEPGRDVRMRPRIDVGVHAKAHRRNSSGAGRDRRQSVEFGRGLDVEAKDAGGQRRFHFGFRFSDSRKHNPSRIAASSDDPLQFAARNDVETTAEACVQIQHGQRRIRFHRVANQMRDTCKRGCEL